MTYYLGKEVKMHNKEEDLWIALHEKVYDLTKFLKEHPGGEEVLLNLAGKDGTQCFDDVGHSQEAKQLKDTFEIGLLQGNLEGNAIEVSDTLVLDDSWTYEEPKKEELLYVPIFVSLGIVVYGIIFYYVFF